MRRFARHLFTAIAALSLLLFVAVCVLWVRSYRPWLWGSGSHPGVKWEARSAHGWLSMERHEVLFGPPFGNRDRWLGADQGFSLRGGYYLFREQATFRQRLPGEPLPPPGAVEWGLPKQTWSYRLRLGVSYPLLCLVTSLPPVLWLWRRRAWMIRRKRLAAGLCPVCGYDLRATPDRCPECGRAAEAVA